MTLPELDQYLSLAKSQAIVGIVVTTLWAVLGIYENDPNGFGFDNLQFSFSLCGLALYTLFCAYEYVKTKRTIFKRRCRKPSIMETHHSIK